ncbi:MAG: GIY-YIG nuclease family protein [Verrucomicrobiota bacterium]
METVYVLTNPAMPGLVKIGLTTEEDAGVRIAQLYTTGVPFPYKLEFACKVPNASIVEDALHSAFAPNRVNPKREFFQIAPEQAIAILRLLNAQDTTRELAMQPREGNVDTQSIAAAEQYSRRRPNLNFEEMAIPVGSELVCTHNGVTAVVIGPKKVRLGDEELYLSAATKQAIQSDSQLPPALYWRFNGRLLRDIYEETYSTME